VSWCVISTTGMLLGDECGQIRGAHGRTLVSYGHRMVPPDQLPPSESETLQIGPARTPWLNRLAPSWLRRAAVVVAFMLGVSTGGGVVWWWNGRPLEEPRSTPASTENSVRLLLSEVVGRTQPEDGSGPIRAAPLRIDGALVHSRGTGTAVVTRIHRPGGSLAIRVPTLPVRLSVNHSYEQIRLDITPRDCVLATQWTPSAQPLIVTWQDDQGDVHTDLGGDHDFSMELELIRYMDAACRDSPTQ